MFLPDIREIIKKWLPAYQLVVVDEENTSVKNDFSSMDMIISSQTEDLKKLAA